MPALFRAQSLIPPATEAEARIADAVLLAPGALTCVQKEGAGRVLYKRIIAYAFGELGLDSVTILLPPSRKRRSIQRLGFCPDGEVILDDERFLRYRLTDTDGDQLR